MSFVNGLSECIHRYKKVQSSCTCFLRPGYWCRHPRHVGKGNYDNAGVFFLSSLACLTAEEFPGRNVSFGHRPTPPPLPWPVGREHDWLTARTLESVCFLFLSSLSTGMEGVHVLETTFSWALQDRGRGSGTFGDAPAFATANGTVVGQQRKKHAEAATAAASCPVTPASPVVGPLDHRDHNHDGDAACGDGVARAASGLCTPRPDAPAIGNKTDEGGGPKTAPVVTPFSISASSPSSSPPPPLLVRRLGEQQQQQQQSPESRAAAEAAQTSLAVVRQSFVRRRGAIMAKKALPPPPVAGAEAVEPASSKRLCSTPFLVRRKPPLSPSAAANSDASPRARGAGGAGGSSSGGTSRPLDLSAGDASAATAGRASSGGGAEKIGGGAAGADPDTPRGSGGSKTGDAPPGAARVVTPATAEGQGVGAAAGAGRKKRKERQQPANQEAGGGASSKGKGRKKSKKRPRVSAAAAGAGGASEGVVTASARPAEAAPAPAPITVTFSAGGSLGMGLMADVTEEGSMCLAGKSPTSAAAPVPDGWRLIEVDGKSVRRLGGGFGERVRGACGCQLGRVCSSRLGRDAKMKTTVRCTNCAVPRPIVPIFQRKRSRPSSRSDPWKPHSRKSQGLQQQPQQHPPGPLRRPRPRLPASEPLQPSQSQRQPSRRRGARRRRGACRRR